MPLDHAQKHLLRLSRQNPAADGWVSVSPVVLPFVKHLPADLIDVEDTKDGWGRAKLTDRGNAVVDYL